MKNNDSKLALYKALNEMDDRRERLVNASSTGRHEPSSMFGGLYSVEEIDDGGRIIERREPSAFVAVSDLPNAAKFRDAAPTGRKRSDGQPAVAVSRTGTSPAVLIRRRGTTLPAL